MMDTNPNSQDNATLHWRFALIGVVVFGSLAIMMLQGPLPQNQSYHAFADSRALSGVPNFGDVASNLAFLVVGLAGLWLCIKQNLGPLHNSWLVMFAGITLVGVASSYYHWTPDDETLVWDRMSLTVGFMGLFVGLLGEYLGEKFRMFLVPAVILGIASVLYWHWFDDLRIYYWVQMVPLLVLPFVMLAFRPRYSHQWLVLGGAILYGIAKLTELGDKVIFSATGQNISGHTLKHLFAGAGCFAIFLALKRRYPV